MKLNIIDTVEQFTVLEENWNDLLAHSINDNPFQSHQWLLTWWKVYGNGTLNIITCQDEVSGELLGTLPLYRSKIGGILGVTKFHYLGSGQGSADFLGCIARKGNENRIYKACLDTLLLDCGRWDIIDLQDMDADSPFCCLLRETCNVGMVEVRNPAKRCPYLSLPESWNMLVNSLSKKVRQRIGYYRRTLDKKGTVVLEEVNDLAKLPGALTDMIRLRQDRMQQKRITSATVTNSYRRFHGELMPRMLKCGKLRFYFLCVDGQRIAYLYLFTGGTGVYFYQTGFDRSWSSQSVGFVLLSMVIEKSISEGFKIFEFLRGEERYKYEWGNVEEKSLLSMTLFSRKPYGLICQLLNKSISLIRASKRFVQVKRKERN